MEVANGDWASNGKFVNSLNKDDEIKLYYNAEKAGDYAVIVTYRSGSAENGFSWSEKDGKIENGTVTMGATDSTKTHQQEITFKVKTAGEGVLTIKGGEKGAPQIDKFDIVSPVKELQVSALEKAIADGDKVVLDDYKDGAAKDAFVKALKDAKDVLEKAKTGNCTQEEIDNAAKALTSAMEKLEEKDQTPAPDKSALKTAIDKAEGLDLTKYQNGAEKDAFVKALEKAKEVYKNDKATEEDISKATLDLNSAMDKLKPIESSNNGGNENNNGNQNGSQQTPQGNGNHSSAQKPSSPVKTGDTAEPFGYMAGMAAGLAAVVALLRRRK